MTGCSWLWLYAGAFLMLAELMAPGFVIFFFGLSAATVGLCRACFGEAFTLTWQLAAFSGFSVVYLVVLRRWLKKLFSGAVQTSPADFSHEYVGRTGTVVTAIEPPLAGRVVVGDAEWTAESATALAAGTVVKVVAQRNLTLVVETLT